MYYGGICDSDKCFCLSIYLLALSIWQTRCVTYNMIKFGQINNFLVLVLVLYSPSTNLYQAFPTKPGPIIMIITSSSWLVISRTQYLLPAGYIRFQWKFSAPPPIMPGGSNREACSCQNIYNIFIRTHIFNIDIKKLYTFDKLKIEV